MRPALRRALSTNQRFPSLPARGWCIPADGACRRPYRRSKAGTNEDVADGCFVRFVEGSGCILGRRDGRVVPTFMELAAPALLHHGKSGAFSIGATNGLCYDT